MSFQSHLDFLLSKGPSSGVPSVPSLSLPDAELDLPSAPYRPPFWPADLFSNHAEASSSSVPAPAIAPPAPVILSSAGKLAQKLVNHFPPLPLPHILSLLQNASMDVDRLASELAEAIGFEGEGFEIVQGLMEERIESAKELSKQLATPANPIVTQHTEPTYTSRPPSPPSHPSSRPYTPGSQILFSDAHSKQNKKKKKILSPIDDYPLNGSSFGLPGSQAEADEAMARKMWEIANRHTQLKEASAEAIQYPHVYSSVKASSVLSAGGRFMLPLGTTRFERSNHEEVIIPPSHPIPPKIDEKPRPVSDLDALCRGTFKGYQTLNRIQSIVFPTAYGGNENMLVCAPTGAGKTDVAMLSILRVLSQHLTESKNPVPEVKKSEFKIIYVAPMKALASEIVRKFAKRLAWLGIKVRELTGDMQLTKAEIAETQVIVTTPEKWDVVTRKPTGEGELAGKVKLLIIDEVHLLNEERGAVIETIVARTLRQVESTQSLIRIVGLSATLPNYIDVCDFLGVSRYNGLFYFDASFRPVPLEQHFLGIRGKTRSPELKKNLDEVTFDKVSELLREEHQCMVFVHSRKETVNSGMTLHDLAQKEGNVDDFDCSDNPKFDFFKKDLELSRNKELKELVCYGIGIHHAGMLRTDRNLVERMFESGCLKVLVCTATLAWGVNLPAHGVIIKGTDVYDSTAGKMVDLSILDVLQIFGRAGRPGFETSGVGFICTNADKLEHYLDAILSQHPIESKFVAGMIDSMNAEIALGTIANTSEAVKWLGYTYLFVRMRKNPWQYGITGDQIADDPQLGNRRNELVASAAKQLLNAGMITWDQATGSLLPTDLGRIAAKYYIRTASIEIFNKELKPHMTEADTLAMLAQSTEFDQIQVRENEVEELKSLMDNVIPCQVKGGTDTSQGKVNILLQAYISRSFIEDFALVSDTAYVAQNAGRIIRALLEIAVSRRFAGVSYVLMSMSKAVEKRMWPFDHPLGQFSLRPEVLHNIGRWADDIPVSDLALLTDEDLGQLIHMNKIHGGAVLAAAKQFPSLTIQHQLRPLTHDLIQIDVELTRSFTWNEKVHGTAEPFCLWVEDDKGVDILHFANVIFRPSTETVHQDMTISVRSEKIHSLTIKVTSDRWIGSEESISISLEGVTMPPRAASSTPLLDIPLLSISAINNPQIERIYSDEIRTLNPIQSQAFWSTYYSQSNLVLCGPSSSGKSWMAELAIWNLLQKSPSSKILLVVPKRHVARDLYYRLRSSFKQQQGLDVSLLNTAQDFTKTAYTKRSIAITYPAALHQTLSSISLDQFIYGTSLLIFDDLQLLDDEYELVASRLLIPAKASKVRVIGLSSSLQDPTDLGLWLGASSLDVFNFKPKDRGTLLATSIHTFTIPNSAALLKMMVKPAFDAIKASSHLSIVFGSSRNQCHTIANYLITQSGTDMDIDPFLGVASAEELQPYASRLRDRSLMEPLLQGIAIYHDGLHPQDMSILLELFASGAVRVLVAPREACWTLPVRAETVVVMGTQYVRLHQSHQQGSNHPILDRQLQNYSLHEIMRMQGLAVGPANEISGKFVLICQADQKDSYIRFLNDGLPLESALLASSSRGILQDFVAKQLDLKDPQDVADFLSHTFLAKRTKTNPSFYSSESVLSSDELLSRVVDRALGLEMVLTPEKNSSASVVQEAIAQARHVPGSGR